MHELLASRDAVSGDNPLREIYEKLIRIRAKLQSYQLIHRWTLKAEDLVPLQMELGAIDALRVDGKFLGPDGSVPEGKQFPFPLFLSLFFSVFVFRVYIFEPS